jgi:hypothetical protein
MCVSVCARVCVRVCVCHRLSIEEARLDASVVTLVFSEPSRFETLTFRFALLPERFGCATNAHYPRRTLTHDRDPNGYPRGTALTRCP